MTQAIALAITWKMSRTATRGQYAVYYNGSLVSDGCLTMADAMLDARLAARRNKLPIDQYVVRVGKNEVRCF